MSKVLKAAVAASSLSIVLGGATLAASAAPAGAATTPATAASCSPTTVPKISSVSAVAAEQAQTITIRGTCFGSGNTFTTSDNQWFQIIDKTGSWSGCHVSSYPENDTVTCTVSKWTNSKIVFTGFSGLYGSNNYTLQTGDHLVFCVWNLNAGDTAKRNNAGKKSIKVS